MEHIDWQAEFMKVYFLRAIVRPFVLQEEEEDYRNPSPPPESEALLVETQASFCESWLLHVLCQLLDLVASPTSVSDSVEDLDKELENQLCLLWDLTADPKNLNALKKEENLTKACLYAISNCTKYPRLVEISVGILANLVNDPEYHEKLISEPAFAETQFMQLWANRDGATLVMLCRFFSTVLENPHSEEHWSALLQQHQALVEENMTFIMLNSTRDDLRKQCYILMSHLLSRDTETWATESMLEAFLASFIELDQPDLEEFECATNILYRYTTIEDGMECIISHLHRFMSPLMKYLSHMAEEHCASQADMHSTEVSSVRLFIDVVEVVCENITLEETVSTYLGVQQGTSWLAVLLSIVEKDSSLEANELYQRISEFVLNVIKKSMSENSSLISRLLNDLNMDEVGVILRCAFKFTGKEEKSRLLQAFPCPAERHDIVAIICSIENE